MPGNLTGRVLAHYRVDALLGAGGMGVVYRAFDTSLRRTVALKVLPVSHEEPAGRGGVLREARAASRLTHPNICGIHEVGEADGLPFIVMEFVDGRALSDLVPPDGLPLQRVLHLGTQVAAAVTHAHAHGIVHRDLKPANVVVTRDGRAKILDFGLAATLPRLAATADSTRTKQLIAGTLAYMAPESLRGETPSEAGDIWALGVLLYEMATGRRPFEGVADSEVISSIVRDPVTLPPSCPAGLRPIILRCLAKEPAERYSSAAEVRSALETLSTMLEPEPAPPVSARAASSRPRAALAAAAGGAALVALSVGLWFALQGDELAAPVNFRLLSTFPGAHREPTLSPDGTMVAFIDVAQEVPQVWVTNLAGGEPRQITFGSVAATRPRWSPANDRIVFARREGGIWEVPPLGGPERQLVARGTNPDLSADGHSMVFERDAEIWLVSPDGAGERRIEGIPTRAYSVDLQPTISPDGSHVAFFVAELGPNGDLWVVPSTGGNARRLTHDVVVGGTPAWTPDGRRIVFSSGRAGSLTLWSISPNGDALRALTTGAGEDQDPVISSDGRTLLYTNVRNSWSLVVRNADTGTERRLLERRAGIFWPAISPDGSRVAFFGPDGHGSVHVFALDVATGDLRQVTRDPGDTVEINTMPRWGRDPDHLYYYQQRPENSLRRVPVVGGPSEEVAPWTWEIHGGAAVHPLDGRIAYVHRPRGQPWTTRVRGAVNGTEADMTALLLNPSWSADGRFLVGERQATIYRCEASALDRCEAMTSGSRPYLPGDGSRLYFLRPGPSRREREVWMKDIAAGTERLLHVVGPFLPIDVHFHVSADGNIIWAPFQEGRHELWMAELR